LAWRSELTAVVRHPLEPSVLVLRSDRSWQLPTVRVREGVGPANATVVVAVFERRLGTRPWLLRQLSFVENRDAQRIDAVFELELLDAAWREPANGRWVGRGDLERLRLRDGQHELLAPYLDGLERADVPAQRPAWARPGWLPNVRAWIESEVARLGHAFVGLEQVKHWSISSVLRVSTDGPDYYFKVPARLPLFVEEASVTARLAERFPGFVPAPSAVEPEQGWLLLPAFEELFRWEAPLAMRCEALRRFAGLQRRTAELTSELLTDGCLDRRLDVLEAQINPLLDDPEAVRLLAGEELSELRSLAPTLQELCRRLARLGVSATLVHGDLHMLNVARGHGELMYFDWTDACVAHPFIDLLTLQWERDESNRAALLDAYLGPWRELEPPERLLEAVHLAAVLIPLHHAVSYQHIVRGLEPTAKPELDITHEFLREALTRAREL
jgi:hypothetical protein